ncbi:MAG: hypothetical protein KDK39_15805 [Leptospiraceae bacterium]|nr:hypothetical protein [Leptospiraceae bacterium]
MGIVLLAGCSDLFKPFQQMSAIDPCDPGSSVYQASSHYFERDFLKHDGSLDYKKLMRLQDPQSSPCDPLYNPGLVHSAPPD